MYVVCITKGQRERENEEKILEICLACYYYCCWGYTDTSTMTSTKLSSRLCIIVLVFVGLTKKVTCNICTYLVSQSLAASSPNIIIMPKTLLGYLLKRVYACVRFLNHFTTYSEIVKGNEFTIPRVPFQHVVSLLKMHKIV